MNITFKKNNKEYFLENNGVNYLLGPNQSGKSYILFSLKEGFSGKNKDFLINNLKVEKERYNVIYFDDTTDFNEEFKFTKNNVFRELIYSNVLNNVNETKLLKEVNELFDKIDLKVNQFLDININKKQEEKMRFDIDISDINDIIDKFTNIYVNNYFIKESNIPRSIKRKLIYNLLLFELKKSKDKENIVIVDNFDLYLDFENTKKIINKLNDCYLKNNNTYFFLSSSNNIYDLISNKSSIYHVMNQDIKKIDKMNDIIEKSLLKVYYDASDKSISFEEFSNENALLFKNEIIKIINEVMCCCQHEIGKLYIANKVRLVKKYEEKYDDITIYCKDKFFQYFYEEIYNILNKID